MTGFILYCIALVVFIIVWLEVNEDLIHDIKREIMHEGSATIIDYVKFIILNVSFTLIFIMVFIKLLQYVELI